MLLTILVLTVSLCSVSAGYEPELSDTELLYTVVVSRHGDRTPDVDELSILPGKVATDEAYWPVGLGGLTNSGKSRAYRMGKYLRKRYDGYLSRVYLPAEIVVKATDYPRTRMTALSALAALYRPEDIQKWNVGESNLDWQPIPYETEPKTTDPMVPFSSCPRYINAFIQTVITSYSNPDLDAKYGKELQLISERSGVPMTSILQMTSLVGCIDGEYNFGIDKPEWAEEMWDLMKEMEDAGFAMFVSTDELIRLSGGKIIQDFMDVCSGIASGEAAPAKLLFLSSHDSTVISALAAARVLKPHRPKYTATFSLEFRKNITSGEYGVATVYAPSADEPAQLLRVDGCDDLALCPLDRFNEITADYRVSNYHEECSMNNPVADTVYS